MIIPFNKMQESLWLIAKTTSASGAYNSLYSWKVKDVSPDSLNRILQKAYKTYPLWRAKVGIQNDRPVFIIDDSIPLDIEEMKIDSDVSWDDLNKDLVLKELDFEKGPLLSWKIVTKSDTEEKSVIFVVSHLITDGQSVVNLARLISDSGFVPEEKLEDYLRSRNEENELLSSDIYKNAVKSWHCFTGNIVNFSLDTLANPLNPCFSFETQKIETPLELNLLLKEERGKKRSDFTTLISIFHLFIFISTGKKNFTIATPVSTRKEKDKTQFDCLINTILTKIKSWDNDLNMYFESSGKDIKEALGFRKFPISSLSETLRVTRPPNRNWPFQLQFIYEDLNFYQESNPVVFFDQKKEYWAFDGNWERSNKRMTVDQCDISLKASKKEMSYDLNFEYRPDLYSVELVKKMAQGFSLLIKIVNKLYGTNDFYLTEILKETSIKVLFDQINEFAINPSWVIAQHFIPKETNLVDTDLPRPEEFKEGYSFVDTRFPPVLKSIKTNPFKFLLGTAIFLSMLTRTKKPIIAYRMRNAVYVTFFDLKDSYDIGFAETFARKETFLDPSVIDNSHSHSFWVNNVKHQFYRLFVDFSANATENGVETFKPDSMDFYITVNMITNEIKLGMPRECFLESTQSWFFKILIFSIQTTLTSPEGTVGDLRSELNKRFIDLPSENALKSSGKKIHQIFQERAIAKPNETAVLFEQNHISYQDLELHSNQTASLLKSKGVIRGDIVLLSTERDINLIIGILGILKVGAAYLPVEKQAPSDRINFILVDSGAKSFLTDSDNYLLNRKISTLNINNHEDFEPLFSPITMDDSEAAYIIYTSGSTGRPKGVQISHCNVTRLFEKTQVWFNFNHLDTWTLFHSYAFDFSVWEIWGALFYGGKLVIVPYLTSRDPKAFLALLLEAKVTILNQTPSAFLQLSDACLESPSIPDLSLRYIIFGGEKLEFLSLGAWLNKFGDQKPQLINMYGITETTVHVTYRRVTISDLSLGKKTSQIGIPIDDLTVFFLDSELNPVLRGVQAEMFVSGAGLARGYLNRPSLTAEKFIPNPFAQSLSRNRLYKTGDLGRSTPDQDIEYLGRIDNQIQLRGFRIELGEIETAISLIGGVKETIVICKESPDGQQLISYIKKDPSYSIKPSEISKELAKSLPNYMIPSYYVFLDAFPLTVNGKIDRSNLPNPVIETKNSNQLAKGPIEEEILNLFSELLNLSDIDLDSNFFEVGGNSILGIRLINLLNKFFGKQISYATFFSTPTPRHIVSLIREELFCNDIKDDSFELVCSPSQRSLWTISQLVPESPVYNIPILYNIEGSLEINTFKMAIGNVIQESDSFACYFELKNGIPTPVLSDCKPEISNFLTSSPAEREQHQKLEATKPFDLKRPSLFRLIFYPISKTHNQLLLVIHHIIFDGESKAIFIKKTLEQYFSLTKGAESKKEVFPKEFLYNSYNQHKKEAAKHYEKSLLFWENQLKESSFLINLPVAGPRPAIFSFQGSTISEHIPQSISEKMGGIAMKAKTTKFSVYYAIFSLVLNRFTGQNNFLIGTPTTLRTNLALEETIGYLVNTIVLANSIQEKNEFLKHVESVKALVLTSFIHGEVPFELVVNKINPSRSLNTNPLFQIMFTYENEPTEEEGEGLVHVTSNNLETNTSHFDLTFSIIETGNTSSIRVEYCTHLFPKPNIPLQLTTCFMTALETIFTNENLPIWQIPILRTSEKEHILNSFNKYQENLQMERITEILEKKAILIPESLALVSDSQQLTYRELHQQAIKICTQLRAKGISTGKTIAICIDHSIDLVVSIFGVLYTGAAYVYIESNLPNDRKSYILTNSNSCSILTTSNIEIHKDINVKQIFLEDLLLEPVSDFAQSQSNISNLNKKHQTDTVNDPAFIIYTSGSTGKPKGVIITNLGIASLCNSQNKLISLGNLDALLLFSSFNFDAAFFSVCWTIISGSRLVIPNSYPILGQDFYECIQKHNVTTLLLPPSVLSTLQHEKMQSIKTIMVAGEALPSELASKWSSRSKLINAYGPSEATIWTTFALVSPEPNQEISIGSPIDNTKCLVLDKNLQILPKKIIGEIYIGGDCLSQGYLGNPILTCERFIPDPYSRIGGKRLYKTGDTGYITENFNIHFSGRVDFQVKIRGIRIEIEEVESKMMTLPEIKYAVIKPWKKEGSSDTTLAAYVILNGNFSQNEILTKLRKELPSFAVPSHIIFVKELPLTKDGSKIDRKALPEPITDTTFSQLTFKEAPTKFHQIWAEILGHQNFSEFDNFFDVGGNSLSVSLLQSKVNDQFNRSVNLTDFFQYPTIHSFINNVFSSETSQKVYINPAKSPVKEIAIIGMSGKFPGAENICDFWKLITEGRSGITFFSNQELVEEGIPLEHLSNPQYVPAMGYVQDIDKFDASFFSYLPREATLLDPQHRLLLEGAWHAFEDAGYNPDTLNKSTGVFVGTSLSTYLINILLQNPDYSKDLFNIILFNDKDFIATRISYKLNLTGPSLTIQTACSTSLAAVHVACKSIKNGECELALAGGIRLIAPAKQGYLFEEGGILSPDGHCRTFDKNGKGMVSGSGFGLVLLKSLNSALDDNDYIYAVIKATAMNNDGMNKVGYTAPSINGQEEVISNALNEAQVDPGTIGFVECHGTGTEIGDPIEIAALNKAYTRSLFQKNSIPIGSLKPNIGHLDVASGIASLIKVALILHHKEIPPSINYHEANPKIDFENGPFYVNKSLIPFKKGHAPRRVGISSFGLGGTNVHMVLEEAPQRETADVIPRLHILPISAKSIDLLALKKDQFSKYLKECEIFHLDDISYTLQVGRKHFQERTFFIGTNNNDALTDICKRQGQQDLKVTKNPQYIFMFPGQGSQYSQMSKALYESNKVFKAHMDTCQAEIKEAANFNIFEIIYNGEDSQNINQTAFTQLSVFSVCYSLAKTIMHYGIEPKALIGHSLGEYIAATIAGVFSLRDVVHTLFKRSELMQKLRPGKMIAVSSNENDLKGIIEGYDVSIAAVNSEKRVVLSGEIKEILNVEECLKSKNITFKNLKTSHAFHSQMMFPILDQFSSLFNDVQISPPKFPFASNLNGELIYDKEQCCGEYWEKHLFSCVNFYKGIKSIVEKFPNAIFIEVGPGRSLSDFVVQILGNSGIKRTVPILGSSHSVNMVTFLESLGKLWASGADLDWECFNEGNCAKRLPLPLYPFQKTRFWPKADSKPVEIPESNHLLKKADVKKWFYIPGWAQAQRHNFNRNELKKYNWVLFLDDLGLAQLIFTSLKEAGCSPILVSRNNEINLRYSNVYIPDTRNLSSYIQIVKLLDELPSRPLKIVHLWGLTDPHKIYGTTIQNLNDALEVGYISLINTAKALETLTFKIDISILAMTNGAHAINDFDVVFPEKATMQGAIKIIPREYPGIEARSVDIDLPNIQGLNNSVAIILEECLLNATDSLVAYRGTKRWVPHYVELNFSDSHSKTLKANGVYLITGGLSGIGMLLARHFSKQMGITLVLTRKGYFPEKENWTNWTPITSSDDKVSQALMEIEQMKLMGANIHALSCDVANIDEVRKLKMYLSQHNLNLNGVIHAAGKKPSGYISETSWESMTEVLNPKTIGTINIYNEFYSNSLDFFINFSSTSSILGKAGFSDYVAANAFLDAFANNSLYYGNRLTTVNWDGWSNVGMAKGTEIPQNLLEMAISNDEGCECIDYILSLTHYKQIIVSTSDFSKMYQKANQGIKLSNKRDEQFFSTADIPVDHPNNPILSNLDGIIERLKSLWVETLGLNDFSSRSSFMDLGGDSLMATMLATKIRKTFNIPFSPKQIEQYSCVFDQASYIINLDVTEIKFPPSESKDQAIKGGNDIEVIIQEISQIWIQALGFEKVDISESFEALGGDSLVATQLASKIRKKYQIKFSPNSVKEHKTIVDQARYIFSQMQNSTSEIQNSTSDVITRILSDFLGQKLSWPLVDFELIKNQSHDPNFIQSIAIHFKISINQSDILGCKTKDELSDFIDTLIWATKKAEPDDEVEMLEFDL